MSTTTQPINTIINTTNIESFQTNICPVWEPKQTDIDAETTDLTT